MKTNEKKSEKKAKKKPQTVVRKKVAKSIGGKGTRHKKGKNNFRATFMENLMVKKRELEETLGRLIDSQKEYDRQLSAADFIDEFDDAQREISAHSHYSLIERKIRELQKIERRISKISEDEEFGLCEECGGPIPKKRLLIMPEATLCVPCQQKMERLDDLKSVLPSTAATFGGKKDMVWRNSGEYDDEGHVAMKARVGSLSVDDLEETETENSI